LEACRINVSGIKEKWRVGLKVVFRVDASLAMGTGHVMRCLTLAQALKENGANLEFICRKHQGNLIDKIRLNGFNVYELEVLEEVDNKLAHSHWLGATQQQDADDCIDVLKSNQTDWLIIDHYALDENWQKMSKPYCKKIMVIDDLADRKHQCDILLDQTFGRQQEDYLTLTPKDCQLLLGSQYALLRPEFSKWRAYSLERRSKPKFKKLLINMGGVDIDNVTEKILGRLKICNLPSDIKVTIVMGGSAPHLESVKSKSITLPYKTEVKVDVGNMAEIMSNSDIAIGAAGSTTWERCCLGLPTIQIVIAKNQLFSAETLAHHNIVKLAKEIKETTYLLESSSEWMKSVGSSALKICDGMGSYKVFNKMADYKVILQKFGEVDLCNYVNLDEHDKMLTLNMRNHSQVKKWMYNQDSISKTEHFNFIKSLESDIDRRYFLIKQKEIIIGAVNFANIRSNKPAIFGFYANPFEQILGVGRMLELTSLHFIFRELNLSKLTLEVFSDNVQVVNLHKKFGFGIVSEKNKNGKKVFCMELSQRTGNESSYCN
jgi:UDP-2,4-diacetamido-2,4,6-trideoxy-beta-L-altropyranose hydrolase/UDP-4-amino-4,6-dideoxy-N-acetyl-beta-L-altrosamine N-acetyltransferase